MGSGLAVETAERLIDQHKRGFPDKDVGKRDTLSLPAEDGIVCTFGKVGDSQQRGGTEFRAGWSTYPKRLRFSARRRSPSMKYDEEASRPSANLMKKERARARGPIRGQPAIARIDGGKRRLRAAQDGRLQRETPDQRKPAATIGRNRAGGIRENDLGEWLAKGVP